MDTPETTTTYRTNLADDNLKTGTALPQLKAKEKSH